MAATGVLVACVTFAIGAQAAGFGNQTVGANSDGGSNYMDGSCYTAGADLVLTSMSVYFTQAGTGAVQLAVYSDDGGKPGALLGTTAARTNTGTGWQAFGLNSPVSVAGGSRYWLLWNSAATGYRVAFSNGGTEWYKAQAYGAWPSLGGAGSVASCSYSVYASGTAPGTGSADSSACLGNRVVGSSSDGSFNYLDGSLYTAPSSQVLTTMTAYFAQAGSGSVQLAIYSDKGGTPGTLLGTTAARSSTGTGWQTFLLKSPVAIVGGAKYWLLWNSAAAGYKVAFTVGGTEWYLTQAYGTWPSAPGAGSTSPCSYSIYASASSVAVPPTTTGAPTIATQPQNATVLVGGQAVFAVAASGGAPMSYQWRKNGTAISGATTSTYVTPAAQASDTGARFAVVVTNSAGSVTSSDGVLTVNAPAPAVQSLSAIPATITAGQGSILTWSVSGATQVSLAPGIGDVTGLSTRNVNPATTTTYTLTARNATGQTATASTTVTVSAAPAAPVITTQPRSLTVTEGQTATFTVAASSSATLAYQWRKNGTVIVGAASASYTTPAVSPADNGAKFSVVVSNVAGGATSSEATLTVSPASRKWYGFGSLATGGSGHPTVHVTNLNNSGTGSLREALAAGNRTIVFDVGGTIALSSVLSTSAANITIDGSTAPAPGITLTGHSLRLINGANNVILTSFRHRGGWDGTGGGGGDPDNITIMTGCHNIVLDHLSLSNSYDENVGIWDGNYDITVQNCILGDGNAAGEGYAMLISNRNLRVSIYHNIFHNAYYRQPAVGWDTSGVEVAPSLVAEVINNVVWDYPTRGTTVYWGGKANVLGNYYFSSTRPGEANRAVNTETQGVSYASGNYSKDGSSVSGTTSTPFAVASYAQIPVSSPAEATTYLKGNAGCRVGGLDAFDISLLGDLAF